MINLYNFYQNIQAADRVRYKNYDDSLLYLEEAHLIAQSDARLHLYVHWRMLLLALYYNQWNEFFGQIPRLILAVPGSILGLSPKGNLGSTKMKIFEQDLTPKDEE